jgi:hypothetical protein
MRRYVTIKGKIVEDGKEVATSPRGTGDVDFTNARRDH